jgi:hypothetical protein
LRVSASSSVSQPKPASNRLLVRLEHLPQVVRGRLVRDVQVSLERFVDHARARADTAVVQVGDAAVEREAELNLAPEVFVGGERVGADVSDRSDGVGGRGNGAIGEGGQHGRGRRQRRQERPSRSHRGLLVSAP